jgi:predicted nucleotidyltransferase
MKRDEIIKRLKEREADLRAHGVMHAALFGSAARGEQRPDSDIDILVDLDPAIVARCSTMRASRLTSRACSKAPLT